MQEVSIVFLCGVVVEEGFLDLWWSFGVAHFEGDIISDEELFAFIAGALD